MPTQIVHTETLKRELERIKEQVDYVNELLDRWKEEKEEE
jgi:hypothetical protein